MKASRPNGPERRPLDRKKPGFFHDLFHKKPLGAFGMIVLILLVLTAVFADFIAPYPMVGGTMQVDVIHKLQEPYFLMSPPSGRQSPTYTSWVRTAWAETYSVTSSTARARP